MLAFTSLAHAQQSGYELDIQGYAVFSGDFYGDDGLTDYYFYRPGGLLILHGEIATPITIPGDPTFAVYGAFGGALGSVHSTPVAINLSETEVAGLTQLLPGVDYFIGDYDGDGELDYLFRGDDASNERPHVVYAVSQTAQPASIYSYTSLYTELASLLADSNNDFYVDDVNSDGKDDLVLRSSSSFVADTAFLSETAHLSSAVAPTEQFEVTDPELPDQGTESAILAGQMEGEAGVSPSGAATYMVPIKVPQGSGGLAPQLAFSYFSQGSNGLMGHGWGLSGVSAITQCFQTLSQDNLIAVNGRKDRFCLDGQRLVVDSAYNYGQSGAVYRTEINSFRKVTAYGSDGENPDYFLVVSKDGKTSRYERRNSGSYVLTKVTDSTGKNSVTYSYFDNDGKGVRIGDIEFAFGTGSTANARVDFIYEDRLDIVPKSLVIGSEDLAKRLSRVEVSNNGNNFRTYHVNYRKKAASEIGVPLSRVNSIRECVGTSCLPATTFDWSIAQSYGFNPVSYCSSSSCRLTTEGRKFHKGGRVVDVNGDGLDDYVWMHKYDGDSYFRVALSNGSYWVKQDYSRRAYDTGKASWHLVDYNGDGQLDLVHATQSGWSVSLFGGSDFDGGTIALAVASDQSKQSLFQDVSGDGLPDLIVRKGDKKGLNIYYAQQKASGGIQYSSASTKSMSLDTQLICPADTIGDFKLFRMQDLDGDGATEIIYSVKATGSCATGSNQFVWRTSELSGSVLSSLKSMHMGISGITDSQRADFNFMPVDLNRDGKSDMVFRDHQKNWSYFIRDEGSETNRISLPEIGVSEAHLIDYNFDGYMDIAWASNERLNVKVWNGSGFDAPIVTTMVAKNAEEHVREFADFNGDGYLEHVRIYDGNTSFAMNYFAPMTQNKVNNVITTITDGYGKTSSFTYKPLTDASVYTKGQGAGSLGWSQPVFDLTGSHYLVSDHEFTMPTAASAGNTENVNYKYKGLRVQGGGRGSLGFGQITKSDARTGSTTTVFSQQFPYAGMPLTVENKTPQGKLLYKRTNVLENISSNENVYWPYVDKSTEDSYLLKNNGASAGAKYKTVVTDSTYDNYGNLELSVTTTKGASGGQVSKVTQTNMYCEGWCREFGRVTNTEISTTRGSLSETREVGFGYYDSGTRYGLLKEENIEPSYQGEDVNSVKLTTSYGYDDYGNRLSTTKTAAGEPSRVSTSIYDADKRYIDQTKDADGRLLTKVQARNSLGLPSEIRTYLDVDGVSYLTTSILYDALGRETFRVTDGSPWVKTEYLKCTSCNVAGAVMYTRVTTETGASSTTYFDVLGRKLRQESLGFDTSDIVLVDFEYDEYGRLERQSEPYQKGSTPGYWTRNTYDISSRTTSVTLPDTTSISYPEPVLEGDLIVSTTINQKQQTHTEKHNVLGETRYAEDHHGGTVEFRYDPLGNVLDTISHGRAGENLGITISVTYDKRGRKKTLTDPDKGAWTYAYNAFGDLTEQENGNDHKVVTDYDRYGRPETRTDYRDTGAVEGHTRWYYDDKDAGGERGPFALGKVTSVVMSGRTSDEICFAATTHYCRLYAYDSHGRQASSLTLLGVNGTDGYFYNETEYDAFGRAKIRRDALDGVVKVGANAIQSGVEEHYTATGHLNYVTDLDTGKELYRVIDTNSRGQVTDFDLNSGTLRVDHNYNAANGRLMSQKTSTAATAAIVQQMEYDWDNVGNLQARNNLRINKKESFCYDHLNRLLQVNSGTLSVTSCSPTATNTQYRYDSIGNITYKDGKAYQYHTTKRHAVAKAGSVNYYYDGNGNLTSDSTQRAFSYTVFDKPELIENNASNDSTYFAYGPDRARYKRIDNRANGDVHTTLYLGGVERTHKTSDGKYHWKRYLQGGAVFTYVTDASNNRQSLTQQYLLKDHIGSTDVVVNANSNIDAEMAFDPWGKRRDNNWQPIEISDLIGNNYSLLDDYVTITTKGYTGHEMVDALGIIHMNGRIYDADLGRFLQADPFIDGVMDTQGYNRYSYVKGNPLTLTDPTGYWSWSQARRDIKKSWDGFREAFKEWCDSCGVGYDSNGNWTVYKGEHSISWGQSGSGGASTPEGSVAGAYGFGSQAEYLAYFLDYVEKPLRDNFNPPELDRVFAGLRGQSEFNDELAFSLVDTGDENSLKLASALANSDMMNSITKNRTSFANLTIDLVQPGVSIFFDQIPIIPETDFVFDLGVAFSDLDGDGFSDKTSIFYTISRGDMSGLDLGAGIEIGNANAQNFFGRGYQVNLGFMGSGSFRIPEINSTNPDGNFFQLLSNMTFSLDAGVGGGVHVGEVETVEFISW
ncbi:FG-GAP-like repeat-containing protein [Microbulbifer agarilyticus]